VEDTAEWQLEAWAVWLLRVACMVARQPRQAECTVALQPLPDTAALFLSHQLVEVLL
jgi:hypothetical protein